MKNIKKTLLVTAAFVGFIGLNNSVLANVAPPASAFELYNKAGYAIYVELTFPNLQKIELRIGANTKKGNFEEIEDNVRKADFFTVKIADRTVGFDVYYNIKAPGKTKYLTYDPSKSMPLYPQTGPLMGWKGETASGYSLSNNISASDITKKQIRN